MEISLYDAGVLTEAATVEVRKNLSTVQFIIDLDAVDRLFWYYCEKSATFFLNCRNPEYDSDTFVPDHFATYYSGGSRVTIDMRHSAVRMPLPTAAALHAVARHWGATVVASIHEYVNQLSVFMVYPGRIEHPERFLEATWRIMRKVSSESANEAAHSLH